MSKPVTFNLAQVLPGDFKFSEVTLGVNLEIEDLSRLQFMTEDAATETTTGFAIRSQIVSQMLSFVFMAMIVSSSCKAQIKSGN